VTDPLPIIRLTIKGVVYPVIHKRRAFEHEKDLRAIVWIGDPAFGSTKSRAAIP